MLVDSLRCRPSPRRGRNWLTDTVVCFAPERRLKAGKQQEVLLTDLPKPASQGWRGLKAASSSRRRCLQALNWRAGAEGYRGLRAGEQQWHLLRGIMRGLGQ